MTGGAARATWSMSTGGWRGWWVSWLPCALVSCTSSVVPDPHAAAQAYASAATRGDGDALYAMMSTPAQQARSRDDVKRMIAEEH